MNISEASYKCATIILLVMVKCTIAENLITPCTKDIVLYGLGNNLLNVIGKVSAQNCAVSRRMKDMSCNVKCEFIKHIKSSQ
jgi:hypothetical protein